jgi:hypothetical protein
MSKIKIFVFDKETLKSSLKEFNTEDIEFVNNRQLRIKGERYKFNFYSITKDCFPILNMYYTNWNKCCGEKRVKRYKNLDNKCKTTQEKLEYMSTISLTKWGCYLFKD